MITMKKLNKIIPLLLIVVILLSFLLVPIASGKQASSGRTFQTNYQYETKLFTKGKLIDLNIDLSPESWTELIENAAKKKYYSCDISINGEYYKNVGVRAKGSSSLDDVKTYYNNNRYSLIINFGKYVDNQTFHGLKKLVLNNCIYDATSMKDSITYDMCSYIGLNASLYNYAKVSLNNDYLGCYLALEPVSASFLSRNYNTTTGTIYEPFGSLEYIDDNPDSYDDITSDILVGKKTKRSTSNVVTAVKSVYTVKDIEKHVDVDSIMKYMAIQTISVNYDGLTGSSAHNYYLYENNGVISIIPWDYNLGYGGYNSNEGDEDAFDVKFDANMSGEEMEEANGKAWEEYWNSLSTEEKEAIEKTINFDNTTEVNKYVNFPIDTPFTCDLSERSFFMKLLENNSYKAKYYKYLAILSSKYIEGGQLNKTIATISDEIGDIVGTEKNAFYSNKQFTTATETLSKMLHKKAISITGQIEGSVPSTWEKQNATPSSLIDASDIDLRNMGGFLD